MNLVFLLICVSKLELYMCSAEYVFLSLLDILYFSFYKLPIPILCPSF